MTLVNFNDYLDYLAEIAADTIVTDTDGAIVSLDAAVESLVSQLDEVSKSKHQKIVFVGNGGSAAIASHCAVDYQKNGGIRSLAMNDPSMLTCLSNDYGYEFCFSKQIEFHGQKKDLLFAISSSGQSPNIINALKQAKKNDMYVITLSGFSPQNKLRLSGHLNFFVNSHSYGPVEITHLTIIHALLDLFMIKNGLAEKNQIRSKYKQIQQVN